MEFPEKNTVTNLQSMSDAKLESFAPVVQSAQELRLAMIYLEELVIRETIGCLGVTDDSEIIYWYTNPKIHNLFKALDLSSDQIQQLVTQTLNDFSEVETNSSFWGVKGQRGWFRMIEISLENDFAPPIDEKMYRYLLAIFRFDNLSFLEFIDPKQLTLFEV